MKAAELLPKFLVADRSVCAFIWKHNGRAIATNGYIFVSAPLYDESLDDAPTGIKSHTFYRTICLTYKVKDLKSAIKKIPLQKKPKTVDCGLCKGNGVYEEFVLYKGNSYPLECGCPVCKGTGQELDPEGGSYSVYDSDYCIKINDLHYRAERIIELLMVAENAAAKYVFLVHDESGEKGFFEIGEYEVILMPNNPYARKRKIIYLKNIENESK